MWSRYLKWIWLKSVQKYRIWINFSLLQEIFVFTWWYSHECQCECQQEGQEFDSVPHLQLVLSSLSSQNCWTSVPALAFIFAFQAWVTSFFFFILIWNSLASAQFEIAWCCPWQLVQTSNQQRNIDFTEKWNWLVFSALMITAKTVVNSHRGAPPGSLLWFVLQWRRQHREAEHRIIFLIRI